MKRILGGILLALLFIFNITQAAQDTFRQNPYLGKPDNIGRFDQYSNGLNKSKQKTDRILEVTDYGAKGDATVSYTGNVSAGSAVFTDLSSASFKPTVNGKTILIRGAGTGGKLYQGTVTYVSPTTLQLSSNASTTVSNCEYAVGTDDGPAIQSMINSLTTEQHYLVPDNPPTGASGITANSPTTTIQFTAGKIFLIATPISVTNRDKLKLTGDGLIIFADITAFTFNGCRFVSFDGLNVDGMAHGYEPTTSTFAYMGTDGSGRRSEPFYFRNNNINRVKTALKTQETPASGPDVMIEDNWVTTWNVPNSVAFLMGNGDNYVRRNSVYGFQTGFHFLYTSTTFEGNHVWGTNEADNAVPEYGVIFDFGKVRMVNNIISSHQRAEVKFTDLAVGIGDIIITGGNAFYRNSWSVNPLIDHAVIEFESSTPGTILDHVTITDNYMLSQATDTVGIRFTNIDTANSTAIIKDNLWTPEELKYDTSSWVDRNDTATTTKKVGIGSASPTVPLDVVGTTFPVLRSTRQTTGTGVSSVFGVVHQKTDGNPSAGFGSGFILQGANTDGVVNNFAALYGVAEDFTLGGTFFSKGGFQLAVFENSASPTAALSGDSTGLITIHRQGLKFPDGTTQTTKAAPSSGSNGMSQFSNGSGGFKTSTGIYEWSAGILRADDFVTGAGAVTLNTTTTTANTVNTRIPAPGAAGYIPYGVAGSPTTYTTSSALFYDAANGRLGVGKAGSPTYGIDLEGSGVNGILRATRTSTGTNSVLGVGFLEQKTSNDAADGFGAGLNFYFTDSGVTSQFIAQVAGVRDGADNNGALVFKPSVSGIATEKLRIASNGLITMSNGGGVPFGSMYIDTALTITVSSAGVWYEVNTGATDFTAGLLKNVTQSDHYMVATTAGYYEVEACASLGTGVAGHKVALTTAVNGTATSYGHGHTTIANSASTSQVCIVNVLSLTAGQEVSLMVQNHSGGVNIDIDHAQAKMKYIGSP